MRNDTTGRARQSSGSQEARGHGKAAIRRFPFPLDKGWGIFSAKDLSYIAFLTLLTAFLLFFRLGNTYAPQSNYTGIAQNPDIVLDFGDYIGIGSVSLYLNCQSGRHFTLSAYNEVTQEWELFNGEALADSVFAWNRLEINYNLRYLGIVALENDTVLNELVAFTSEGEQILPVNSGDYPELFDEQEMYPEYNSYMAGTMFDEVYHARTAYEIIHGIPAYETTHPHLGKILISLGIRLFGMTPFGMRFMSALFGILMVPLIYAFAKRMFHDTFCAAVTTSLLAFDCMHFTMSRISELDVFATFFILLMYYWMYRYIQEDSLYRENTGNLDAVALSAPDDKMPPRNVLVPLALCGVSMGLGVATKWTGAYAGAGLALIFLVHTVRYRPGKQLFRLFFFCCVFFILVPLAIYALSFLPVVSGAGYTGILEKAVLGTIDMFNYHANLVAEHPYSSQFYEWPIIWKPLFAAYNALENGKCSAVSMMGNPAVWWPGIPCCLYVLYRGALRRDRKAGFLSIAYLAQYVPWMLVSRITFIYHYFPSAVMMLLCMGYTCSRAVGRFQQKGKTVIALYLVAVVFCFALFYPVVSGYPVSSAWGQHLRWLKEWVLAI